MQYLHNEQVWLLDPPAGESFEVLVPGSQDSPSEERLAQAASVLSDIQALQSLAQAYLDSFIDRSKFAEGSDWQLVGVEFGRLPIQPASQFSLFFSVQEDPYGEWSVSLQTSSGKHNPIGFARRQL